MIVGISGLFTASVQSDDLESVKKVKWTYEACMKGNIPLIGAQHVEIDVTWSGRYFREEVIPWFFQFVHLFHALVFNCMKSISD